MKVEKKKTCFWWGAGLKTSTLCVRCTANCAMVAAVPMPTLLRIFVCVQELTQGVLASSIHGLGVYLFAFFYMLNGLHHLTLGAQNL